MLGVATQLPAPDPPPPHWVPVLSEAILRSLVAFSIIPRGWRGTVVRCPSPVLVPMEVSTATEGSGIAAAGLQGQITAGEDGSSLGCFGFAVVPLPCCGPQLFLLLPREPPALATLDL